MHNRESMASTLRWVLGGVGFVVAACSPQKESTSGEAAGGGGDDLARLAAALCEREVQCGCGDVEPADCETLHYEGLRNYGLSVAAESDAYALDRDCLRELADCWEQLECGQSYADAMACAPSCAVHRMNVGVGGDCYDSWVVVNPPGLLERCEDGLTCQGGHGYSVCDTPTPLRLGDSCFDAGNHKSCGAGLYCTGQESGPGECALQLGEGAACEGRGACQSGLRCNEGACGPLGRRGEGCSLDSDCDDALQCHPLDGVCVPLANVGEPCRLPTEHGVEFLSCVEGTWCGEEACEPTLDLGAPCEFSDGCPLGSSCHEGSCTDCSTGACGGPLPLCGAIPDPAMYPPAPE